MELAEESLLTSNLTQEGGLERSRGGERRGGARRRVAGCSRPIVAPASAIKAKSRPWPLILAFVATFAVDMVAVTVSCLLAKSVAHGVGWHRIR